MDGNPRLKEVSTMQIEKREVTTERNYLDPVTYIPAHANGNAAHPDCEQGVIISVEEKAIRVLYCKGRKVQQTNANDLVFG